MITTQTIRGSQAFGRHVHKDGYAAVVLAGGYEEAGDSGRFRVEAGDVVFHEAFEAHQDQFTGKGALVWNVRLPACHEFQPGLGRISDADFLVRVGERDETAALAILLSSFERKDFKAMDWPDELAKEILRNPSLCLSAWSEKHGIRPWAISRGFARVFGISPSAFRARARVRLAWKAIQATKQPMAEIAFHLGFADQSHMARSVKSMTGRGPRDWRVAGGCK